jgi:23S rRNA pseudouridine2604 synthase
MTNTAANASEGMRINRYLASAGVCSRRKADELVAAGEVTVDGRVATTGERVSAGQVICLRGRQLTVRSDHIYIALNKPEGITCTASREDPDNVIDFLGFERRIFPVGRLDKPSSGLLLLTDDGETANRILRTDGFHEKEYQVRVDQPIDDNFIRSMTAGVPILDTVTLPCKIIKTGPASFTIVLTQGLNRQIRRMCEYNGRKVVELSRTRIMNIRLGNLPIGKWRNLTDKEVDELMSLLSRAPSPRKETPPNNDACHPEV